MVGWEVLPGFRVDAMSALHQRLSANVVSRSVYVFRNGHRGPDNHRSVKSLNFFHINGISYVESD